MLLIAVSFGFNFFQVAKLEDEKGGASEATGKTLKRLEAGLITAKDPFCPLISLSLFMGVAVFPLLRQRHFPWPSEVTVVLAS